MNKLQSNVSSFMESAGQDIPSCPTTLSPQERILRAKLILEEANETLEALGLQSRRFDGETFISEDKSLKYDEVKAIDGIIDLIYVAIGAANAMGVNLERIWDIVHKANMNKFSEGSYKREDGKWMKPKDWQSPEPKIEEEISKQRIYGNFLK